MAWQSAVAGLDAWTLARVLVATGFHVCALMAVGSRLFLFAFPVLPPNEGARVVRTGVIAACVGFMLLMLQWPLQAAYLGGEFAAAADPVLLGMVHDSPQGTRLLLGVGGLSLLLGSLSLRWRGSVPGWVLGLGGTAFMLLAFTQVGHTRGEPRALLATMLFLHLLAIAFWAASLPPLWRVSRWRDPGLASAVLDRFGRFGLIFVPALVASGTVLAVVLLSGFGELFGSAYGQLLLAKLLLAVAVLGLGALNKWHLVPSLPRHPHKAGAALRRSITVEAALMVGIVIVTAVFTTVASPGEA
ncbi:MAG: copper resistance D family protein [Lysobacteraceae bacterium]